MTQDKQSEKNRSFLEHEEKQYLEIAEKTTPYERWLWLEESLEIFGETILRNRKLLSEEN